MATYTVNAGEYGAYEKTLTASTVDTVTFNYQATSVEVTNHSTSATLYVRLDGTDPAVGAAGAILVPAGYARTLAVRGPDPTQSNTEVRVISSGTPTYSVAKAV